MGRMVVRFSFCPPRTTRQVHNQRSSSNTCRPSGQHRRPDFLEALLPHGLPDAGYLLLYNIPGGFGRPIGWSNASSPHREKNIRSVLITHQEQRIPNFDLIILNHLILLDHPGYRLDDRLQLGSARIFLYPGRNLTTDDHKSYS